MKKQEIDLNSQNHFDDTYGIIDPGHSVVVRTYSDDSDDQLLSEIQPRYIIMFEPNLDFIRRIEVSCFLSV
jgi:DNA excision repair protein ERCC-4